MPIHYALAIVLGPVGDVDGDDLADWFFSYPLHPGLGGEFQGVGVLVNGALDLKGEHTIDEVGTDVRGVLYTSSDPAHGGIGHSVASPGDLNGDAQPDFVLQRWSAVFEPQIHGSVYSAGDTNGDGLSDFLLGVEDGGQSNQGVTYLVRGGGNPPSRLSLKEEPLAPDGVVRIFGPGPTVQSGRIGPAGDFNADGHDDFLIGTLLDSPSPESVWKLFLILGGDAVPGPIHLETIGGRGIEIPGPTTAQVFLTCRESGDLDGDGQPDFAVRSGPGLDGKPGSVYVVFGQYGGTTFRRGDASFDGKIQISDAIYTLAYLFLGGEAPRCEDAVDADDDGKIVLTDAVYVLNHLFAGGPEPPEPYPDEGKDPTEDQLGCRGF